MCLQGIYIYLSYRDVSYEEGKSFSESMQFEFYKEASAKNGDNVDEVFNAIVTTIIDKLSAQISLQSQKISGELSKKLSRQSITKKHDHSCC